MLLLADQYYKVLNYCQKIGFSTLHPSEFQEAVDFPGWVQAVNLLDILSLVDRLSSIQITSTDNSQDAPSNNSTTMSGPTSGLSAGCACDNYALAGIESQTTAGLYMGGSTPLLFINPGPWYRKPEKLLIGREQIKCWVDEQIENSYSR